MTAGALHQRVTFRERATTSDGAGNERGAWVDIFETRAEMIPARGNETVLAARLEGVQPMTLRIRSSQLARSITPDWSVRDQRTGIDYAIKAVSNVDQRNAYLDILITAGVAL